MPKASTAESNFAYKPEMRKFKIVDTELKLYHLSKEMARLEEFAFDTETNTLKTHGPNSEFRMVGLSISWGSYNNYYIPTGHLTEDSNVAPELIVHYLGPVFERKDVQLIGHNIKFDMHVLKRIGIEIKTKHLFDTMIASWLCDENSPNGLKENSKSRLHVKQRKFKEITDQVDIAVRKAHGLKKNSSVPFSLVPIILGAPYALEDAYFTWELYCGYLQELEDEGMMEIYERMYRPYIRVLFDMEETGMCVQRDILDTMKVDIVKDMADLEYQMFEISECALNLNSSDQLCALLYGIIPVKKPKKTKNGEKPKPKKDTGPTKAQQQLAMLAEISFGLKPVSFTDSGNPSTSTDSIFRLCSVYKHKKRHRRALQFLELLKQYKKLSKLNSAFVAGMEKNIYDDGKMHPKFNIIGTDSGRLSCQDPNMQQLPKAKATDKYKIRELFMGDLMPDGQRMKVISIDYSNLEMRVMGHWSKDKNLVEMFAQGKDVHGTTAVNMFELDCDPKQVKELHADLRQAAKIINFLLAYGGSAKALYIKLRDDHDTPIDLADKKKEFGVRNGVEVAQIYIDKYFESYAGVRKFIKGQHRRAHERGYIRTLVGRKRRLPGINSGDGGTRAYYERLSVNACIQGSAADIVVAAQNRIAKDKWFKKNNVSMLLQIHDEIVFQCPPDEELIKEAMERATWHMEHAFGDAVELNVYMKAEANYGDTYQEAK